MAQATAMLWHGLGKGMAAFTVLEGNRTLTRFVLPAKESADHAMKA